jgi:hypothetical protein
MTQFALECFTTTDRAAIHPSITAFFLHAHASGERFELSQTGPKPVVLPLDDPEMERFLAAATREDATLKGGLTRPTQGVWFQRSRHAGTPLLWDKDSNLNEQIQSLPSYLLDDPRMATVGIPSPREGRSNRSILL